MAVYKYTAKDVYKRQDRRRLFFIKGGNDMEYKDTLLMPKTCLLYTSRCV